MSKKDLYCEITISVIQTLVVMVFLVTIAAALIIIENITFPAALMICGVFAILMAILIVNEIMSIIRLYTSKEEEL